MQSGPKYKNPPVVETVLSLQFAPLAGFTTAHAGRFWKEELPTWERAIETSAIEDVIEEFPIRAKMATFQIHPGNFPNRIQLVDQSDERMVQLQNSRFIYNWRKRSGLYPSYGKLLPEFKELYLRFEKFCATMKLGAIEPNQWEVSYINHIPKGDVWTKSSEWGSLMPGLYFPKAVSPESIVPETLGGDWKYAIAQNRARLHISLREGRTGGPNGSELLAMVLTVRGGVGSPTMDSVYAGFDLGHDTIVNTFAEIFDRDVQRRVWERIS